MQLMANENPLYSWSPVKHNVDGSSYNKRAMTFIHCRNGTGETVLIDCLTSARLPHDEALGLKPTDAESATLGLLSCEDQEMVTGPGETRAAVFE